MRGGGEEEGLWKGPAGQQRAQAGAHYSGRRREGSARVEVWWNTDCAAERERVPIEVHGRLLGCPVLRIGKRGDGMQERRGAAEVVSEEEKARELKAGRKKRKKSEVLIFYEREDLLPRLRAISY